MDARRRVAPDRAARRPDRPADRDASAARERRHEGAGRALAARPLPVCALVGRGCGRGRDEPPPTSTSSTRRSLPYESAEAAARIAAELGKPWVADLRDPWALDEMMRLPDAGSTAGSSGASCARVTRERRADRHEHARGGAPARAGVPGAGGQAGADPERFRCGRLRGRPEPRDGRGLPDRAHRLSAHRARPRQRSAGGLAPLPRRRRARRRHPHALARLPARGDRPPDRARPELARPDRAASGRGAHRARDRESPAARTSCGCTAICRMPRRSR